MKLQSQIINEITVYYGLTEIQTTTVLNIESKYKKVGVLLIQRENMMIFLCFLSDEGPTLETLDFTICIGSTPTCLYFDLYLNTAYAAHYTTEY